MLQLVRTLFSAKALALPADGQERPPRTAEPEEQPPSRPATLLWVGKEGEQCDMAIAVPATGLSETFSLNLPLTLPVGQKVWIDVRGQIIPAFVSSCSEGTDGIHADFRLSMSERRRYPREKTQGVCMLSWTSGDGVHHQDIGSVRDVSEGGLQVEVSKEIPLREVVRLSGQSYECLATVCYCISSWDRRVVGLQFVREPYLKDSLDYRD